MPSFRVEYMNWQSGFFELAEDDLQFSSDEGWTNLVVENPGQPPSLTCGLYRRFVRVALQSRIDKYAQIVAKLPLR